jgi:steroid 5-alpha reductase family enzyme
MLSTVLLALIVAIVFNLLLFITAYWRQSDKLTDVSYALTFILLAVLVVRTSPAQGVYGMIGISMVVLWACRIGGFLLYRVIRVGRDMRFDDVRNHFMKFGRFWLGQAITVWLLMLPIVFAFSRKNHLGSVELLSVCLWVFGFGVETIADLQKYRFRSNQRHANHWIDTGLWRFSRHPNYFGEILVWCSIYLYAYTGMSAPEKIIALVSPLLISILLLFVSGIPTLEHSADKRWGSNPSYESYKQRTSILVPLPRRKV